MKPEERKQLLDDDGAILLSLREEVGNQILGEGLCDGEGNPLGFNDPVTERIGDQISAHVKGSLDFALRNLASQEQGGEEGGELPWAPEPDVDLDPMSGMGAHEAWMDGWAKGHAAAKQPPPAAVERPRELLDDAEFRSAVLAALGQPPPDSQGENV